MQAQHARVPVKIQDIIQQIRSSAQRLPGVDRAEVFHGTGGFRIMCVEGDRKGHVIVDAVSDVEALLARAEALCL